MPPPTAINPIGQTVAPANSGAPPEPVNSPPPPVLAPTPVLPSASSVTSTPATPNSIPKSEEKPAEPERSDQGSCANPTFFYTQGDFWGGATLNYTVYRILSIVGGLLALDHFYLRSPTTAIAKILLNFITFGFWYFYDILQAVSERDDVEKFGISIPWYGPAGIGAGGFISDTNPKVENSSPFWFMLYSIGLFILPFGLDYLVAGDVPGAAYKAISTLMVFGIIYTFINIYKLLVHPEQVMCEGTTRYFPGSIIFDKHYKNALFSNKGAACPPDTSSSGSGFFSGIFRGLGNLPVVGPVFKVADAVSTVATKLPSVMTSTLGAAAAKKAPALPSVQGGGGQAAEQASLVPGFTLALLFITAIFYRGRETISQMIERGQARPPAIGTILWRKENVGDVPPPAP